MKKFLKEEKAQIALETLLIIGGVLIVASMVAIFLKNLFKNVTRDIGTQGANIINK